MKLGNAPSPRAAVINRRARERLQAGHPWVYRSDIDVLPQGDAGVVPVYAANGRLVGRALYSPASVITLRLVSAGAAPFDAAVLQERLRQARQRRERLLPQADAFRLVHGEADFLPGMFVDRYADCLSVQTTCAAADLWLPELTAALLAQWMPRSVVLRNDAKTRSREKLPREARLLHGSDASVAYHEGDVRLQVDLLADQKTGGFLDQAINHVRAADFGAGACLDCCTYHGGFALQLARRGLPVTAFDLSPAALTRAQQNAASAGLTVDFRLGDVFELLPALHASGARYDTLVLDPPAFASGKDTVETALRAYKEINRRAMRLLRPGGILITCSCSGRITPADFDATLAAAGVDARRALHFVQRWSAGPDHPVLAGAPETDYLKCRVLMVV